MIEALKSRITDIETQVILLKAELKTDLAIIRAHKDAKITELNAEIRDLKRSNQYLLSQVSDLSSKLAKLSEKVNDLHDTIYVRRFGTRAILTSRK